MSLSPETRSAIRDLASRGIPLDAIAEQMGFDLDLVKRAVAGPEYMLALQRRGYGEHYIARMLGVSVLTVKMALKKLKDGKVRK